MRQVSLLAPGIAALAHVMPDVRAAMRQIAGSRESEGRKALVDKLNQIASEAEIKLTGGNTGLLPGNGQSGPLADHPAGGRAGCDDG